MSDAERLSQDPPFRLIGSEQLWEHGAALTSRAHSFETELLTQDENLAGPAAINREPSGQCESDQWCKNHASIEVSKTGPMTLRNTCALNIFPVGIDVLRVHEADQTRRSAMMT